MSNGNKHFEEILKSFGLQHLSNDPECDASYISARIHEYVSKTSDDISRKRAHGEIAFGLYTEQDLIGDAYRVARNLGDSVRANYLEKEVRNRMAETEKKFKHLHIAKSQNVDLIEGGVLN